MSETLTLAPRLLSVTLAAQYLSVGKTTIRQYVKTGLLEAVALPAVNGPADHSIDKFLIPRESLDRFVDSMPRKRFDAEDQP
jgi:hypothetical protein